MSHHVQQKHHMVSDEEFIQKFREIGEGSVRKIILAYFREELGESSLVHSSRVFPEPENRGNILLNRLAVRLCLYKNWPGIQNSYPCLHDFEYVVGDADFLYTIRFPFIDLTTYKIRVVETVQDFVDFTFDFIQSLCIPTIHQSNKNCCGTREQILKALEKCKTSKCTATREEHLRYVLDLINSNSSADASSSMQHVTAGGTDYGSRAQTGNGVELTHSVSIKKNLRRWSRGTITRTRIRTTAIAICSVCLVGTITRGNTHVTR